MEKIKNVNEKEKSRILHWLILAALGLALIIGHNLAQDIIGKMIAVGLILVAVFGLVAWWKEKDSSIGSLATLLGEIAFLLLGFWILFNTSRFISIINVVIGAVIILIGAKNLILGIKFTFKLQIILAIIAIILGIIVVFYNAATTFPVICQGIGLIYTAAVGYLGEKDKDKDKEVKA